MEKAGKDSYSGYEYGTFSAYFQTWKTKLSHAKTVTTEFHLYNKEAKHEFKVYNTTKILPFCTVPTYFEIKLDRTLSYRHHMEAPRKRLFARHQCQSDYQNQGWVQLLRNYSQQPCIWFIQLQSTAHQFDVIALTLAERQSAQCRWMPASHYNGIYLRVFSDIQPDVLCRQEATLSIANCGCLDLDRILRGQLHE